MLPEMGRLHEGRGRQREINENFILNDIVNGVEEGMEICWIRNVVGSGNNARAE